MKNCAKFLYYSTQNPARESYSGRSGTRSAPPQEKCPLQDKFLAMPMKMQQNRSLPGFCRHPSASSGEAFALPDQVGLFKVMI